MNVTIVEMTDKAQITTLTKVYNVFANQALANIFSNIKV